MKKAKTTVLAMLAITGLLLAGSDASSFTVQLLACTGGIMLFAASMFGIARG